MNIKRFFMITLVIAIAAITFSTVAMMAGTTVVVTPTNQQGWSKADTRPGGDVNFVVDSIAPSGNGALQLTTDATTAAKAQYMHDTLTPLVNVTELSYYTKQVSASFAYGDPSYQLETYLNGTAGGFTTLVFEPYYNPGNNGNPTVTNNLWQQWDVDSGLFWSSKTVTCSMGTIVGTAGGPASYTLAQIKTICPNAVVTKFGVNVGTYNPLYNVETDLFDFNGTTYDFEPYEVATTSDQCKNGGFNNVKRADGSSFKDQGDCVSYTKNGK